MARENKLYSKTRVTSIAQDDLLTIGQYQSDGTYKVKTIERDNAIASLNARTVTYAQLTDILTGTNVTGINPSLVPCAIPMMWYKITNATSASFNLYVQAVAVNEIGCEAKDPLYPNDKVVYNFATNTITWRWDTIADISAGEDWRNSSDLQIGDNCTHIEIGANCIIAIGDNCSNIKIGNGSGAVGSAIGDGCENIEIGNNCSNVKIFAGSTFINIANNGDVDLFAICNNIKIGNNSSLSTIISKTLSRIFLGDGVSISATNNITDLFCYAGADISASTIIYSVTQTKTMQYGASGLPRLIYLNGSNVLVNVDAEA
ncbi:hypothetical protein UFOVP1615_12 [uncultured Caudovirales phage]|uniref:Uncharacterized protein n=1 Tax=uncultured Caudovirales phage TaxID=2100421 RepID=A0A6J5SXT5_9CAUD|nr:hypothetical protein UFOVP1615_12 [uncultured Caudovirales phage]